MYNDIVEISLLVNYFLKDLNNAKEMQNTILYTKDAPTLLPPSLEPLIYQHLCYPIQVTLYLSNSMCTVLECQR